MRTLLAFLVTFITISCSLSLNLRKQETNIRKAEKICAKVMGEQRIDPLEKDISFMGVEEDDASG